MLELDALRGIAAMSVVLFHYTTRYQQLFGHTSEPSVSLPWGHYGVNLFFMISGFVIFMTLDKTRSPMDFVVSRFSRLYPAFWAAVALTFLCTHWLGLPGKEVGLDVALLNLFMIHGLFGIPDVDAVYWTLQVELIFYALALLAFRMRWLGRVPLLLGILFTLSLVYFGFASLWGIALPWVFSQFLILKYIPWFGMGIVIYRLTRSAARPVGADIAVLLAAIGLLWLVESAQQAILAAALGALMWGASRGRLAVLRNPVLVWLGTVSYTLYLTHENIGWALLRKLQGAGMGVDVSIVIVLAIALVIAGLLTKLIEQPAMVWVRRWYQGRQKRGAALA
ncbi:acyltransferase family protein [Roseateles toxinivorans]|uniref:acyltransferase family protein n=1 Tax=Roseateles toxinivorans TaxID=270368 RepID=UPI001414ED7D|nr:acyltransferase [Roseateles toxinivorans]